MKDGWEKRFDEMWFSPNSTIMNWSGLFKEQSFIESLFGLGGWRSTIAQSLKKELANLVKSFIKSEEKV